MEFSAWRRVLKMDYLIWRDRRCRSCGDWLRGEGHMHEGIYSRRDVMGWRRDLRVLIQTPYNNVMLCRDCNLGLAGKSPPDRWQVLEEHVARYGLGVLRWMRSLPFKSNPMQVALEEGGRM